jgi:hypothetical protein
MAAPPAGSNLEEFVCRDLTEEQLRRSWDGHNSVAWLIWHMARCEDVGINTVIRGVPEVINRDGWPDRLNICVRDIGTGMDDNEVADFSARVDVAALRAYRAAVGRETRRWAEAVDFAELDAVADAAGQLARHPEALHERAGWVVSLWGGKTRGFLLFGLAVTHNHNHLGEADHIGRMLGAVTNRL